MTRRAWRQLRTTFLLLLGVFVGGMVAMSAYTLWRLRGEAVANALGIAAMHSRGFEDFLTQSLHLTELVAVNSLAQVSLASDARGIERTFVAILKHALFLRSMSLLDDAGRIVASSNPANLGVKVATQGYLPADAGRLQILRIGKPWTGRDFASGQPSTAGTPVDADSLGFIPVTRGIGLGKVTTVEALTEAAQQLLKGTDLTDKKIRLLGVGISNFEGFVIPKKNETETDQLKLF